MRVGIMSMQRVMNYGSFLQAYGLMRMIQQLGHDVEFVDYHPGECVVKSNGRKKIGDYFTLGIRFLSHRSTSKKRKMYRLAATFPNQYTSMLNEIGVTPEKHYGNEVDVLVIGSDEVFNCLQDDPGVGFSPELFGQDVPAKRCISFSACFGTTTLDRLREYGKDAEIAQYLQHNFNAISVRDQNSKYIVSELTDKEVNMNLDPVLLYSFQDELPIIQESNYIIVYAYRGRITKSEGKAIKAFAKKHNKKLIALGGVQDFCDEYRVCNAFEILAYIKNADYVITDTFHGTVFSIKYGKKFAVMIRESNKEKLTDLLKKFSLEDRCVSDISCLEDTIKADWQISTEKVNEKLEHERENALEYLRRQIK